MRVSADISTPLQRPGYGAQIADTEARENAIWCLVQMINMRANCIWLHTCEHKDDDDINTTVYAMIIHIGPAGDDVPRVDQLFTALQTEILEK